MHEYIRLSLLLEPSAQFMLIVWSDNYTDNGNNLTLSTVYALSSFWWIMLRHLNLKQRLHTSN